MPVNFEKLLFIFRRTVEFQFLRSIKMHVIKVSYLSQDRSLPNKSYRLKAIKEISMCSIINNKVRWINGVSISSFLP